ncbi:MAG: helix-turn-helix domain-containing protein [Myxococcales bacterium]|nr:helix-turn-helix domain-containing protein [Myxococcales bacterium]
MSTIGERIAGARDAANLTQEELARRLKVGTKSVWLWEKDQSAPRSETLQQLAKVLALDVGWLLTGVGSGDRNTPESHLERDDDPAVHDEFLAKFLADFATEFSPEVMKTLRTRASSGPTASGRRP